VALDVEENQLCCLAFFFTSSLLGFRVCRSCAGEGIVSCCCMAELDSVGVVREPETGHWTNRLSQL
jgi:hypothetical protein